MLDAPKVSQLVPRRIPGSAVADAGLSLPAILHVLLRRRLIITASAGVALLLGVAYLVVTPARYTATASMIIDSKRIQFLSNDMLTEGVDQAAVDSQVETIRSEKIAHGVVKSLRLFDDPEFVGAGPSLFMKISALFGLTEPDAPSQAMVRAAISGFKSGLRVTRIGRSYVVDISYTSLDPEKAARIANESAEAYINDQLEAKFQATQRAGGWLQQRIGELRQQASEAYRAVQDFKLANNIIVDAQSGRLTNERELDELTSSLSKARADFSEAQAKLERIVSVLRAAGNAPSSIPDPAVTDALNNAVITRLRQQYLDAQKQEADYSARYGKNHQATANLRIEMEGIQRAIWHEVRRIAETYKSEVEITRSREHSIDNRVTELFQQSGTTRQAQVKLRELETAANTYRTIYENFLNRYTQAVQQQSFPATEARVITSATAPTAKSSPKTLLTLGLSLFAGLGLGVAAAFAREQLDAVIRTRDQLERGLGVSCIGVVPFIGKRNPAPWSMLGRWLTSDPTYRARRPQKTERPQPLILLQDDQPFSPVAEALRAVKVTIDVNRMASENRIIGFSSAWAGEGKTTLAATFAATTAKANGKTLLIDGDLRNPSLSRALQPKDGPGLFHVLSKRATLEESAIANAKDGFDFLSGPVRGKAVYSAEYLSSRAMAELLDAARDKYDYIIVDLPPLLVSADVRAAAHLIDAFILVVEWGRTTIDDVEKSLLSSSVLSERLCGVILNKADVNVMRRFEGYGGLGYGYHAYGYGPTRS